MNEEVKIPKGWELSKLGEICSIVSGNTPKGLEAISNKGENHFYKVSDMNLSGNEVKMKFSNLKLTNQELQKLKVKVFPKGTVIFPKRGGAILTNKKRILSEDSSFDLNVMGIIPNKNVLSLYLFYWILKLDLKKIYDGSNVPQINNKNISPLEFPLPPLSIQQSIVAKIEELFSELDKGKEQLETALQQLKIYRQAVLKWAFEGKLTNKEVKDGELPEGWKWVKLGDVADINRGKSKHRPRDDKKLYGGSYPFIQTGDVRAANGGVVMEFRQTYSEFGLKQSKLWPKGTLCLTIAANIAETAFLGFEGCFPDSVVGIVTNENILSIKFTNYFVQKLKNEINKKASATAQKNINVDFLEKLEIVLPSIQEQFLVVQEIESRLSVCDKIEATLANSLKQAESLRQSILKKAFEGKLV